MLWVAVLPRPDSTSCSTPAPSPALPDAGAVFPGLANPLRVPNGGGAGVTGAYGQV